jgi:hypothetical protein
MRKLKKEEGGLKIIEGEGCPRYIYCPIDGHPESNGLCQSNCAFYEEDANNFTNEIKASCCYSGREVLIGEIAPPAQNEVEK